ncbi:hypothetical protein R3P38DRAFT_2844018 [Favolaschia claudopus]|uniref:F-box domain-containing protein n=1 Tax=Favolaschia claudopus TaxID=2862362 RepID=A0AAW0E2Q7_9AGAR
MDPVFPPELEREIFEIAAWGDRSLIPPLLRVCRRVHQWIEPLLYRVLRIANSNSDSDVLRLLAFHSKPAANFLRHVFMDYNSPLKDRIADLLSRCNNIVSLFWDGDLPTEILPILDTMKIQKMNIWVSDDVTEWPKLTLHRPMLHSVTHLELYSSASETESIAWEEGWANLASLPALTHLCLTDDLSDILLDSILEHCSNLDVVITAFWDPVFVNNAEVFAKKLTTSINDRRVVVIRVSDFRGDWESGAWGGDDFWTRSERFVAKKLKGEIESTQYFLDEQLAQSVAL